MAKPDPTLSLPKLFNNRAPCVPFHRVIAANGDLSRYRWGIECKRPLFEIEASAAD